MFVWLPSHTTVTRRFTRLIRKQSGRWWQSEKGQTI